MMGAKYSERRKAEARVGSIERLKVERRRVEELLAMPDRVAQLVRSRKMAAVVVVLLAMAPLALYASGKSFNRPGGMLEIHRDLLLRDALQSAAPTLDACYRGEVPRRIQLYVNVDARGHVQGVTPELGAPFDAACATRALAAKIAVPPGVRPAVTAVEVPLFPPTREE